MWTSIIFRCPLSGQTVNCTSIYGGDDTFTPIDGAGASTTIYWANHADNADLNVFSWW